MARQHFLTGKSRNDPLELLFSEWGPLFPTEELKTFGPPPSKQEYVSHSGVGIKWLDHEKSQNNAHSRFNHLPGIPVETVSSKTRRLGKDSRFLQVLFASLYLLVSLLGVESRKIVHFLLVNSKLRHIDSVSRKGPPQGVVQSPHFLKKITFIYFRLLWVFVAVWGLSLVSEGAILIMVASLVPQHRLKNAGSIVEMHWDDCPMTCGIFSDQGSNPCTLHWQVDS